MECHRGKGRAATQPWDTEMQTNESAMDKQNVRRRPAIVRRFREERGSTRGFYAVSPREAEQHGREALSPREQ